jgi:hypothetical protein
MRFQRGVHVEVTHVGDEYLVIDPVREVCHVLNETAGWLLAISRDMISLREASDLARNHFSGTDEGDLEEDIRAAASLLQSQGLLEIEADS